MSLNLHDSIEKYTKTKWLEFLAISCCKKCQVTEVAKSVLVVGVWLGTLVEFDFSV
jgi:hypothetical protein